MRKTLFATILCVVFTNVLHAQKVHWGTEFWVTKEGSHKIRYTRQLQIAKDEHGKGATNTKTYVTKYDLFNDAGRQIMSIVVEHIKKEES